MHRCDQVHGAIADCGQRGAVASRKPPRAWSRESTADSHH